MLLLFGEPIQHLQDDVTADGVTNEDELIRRKIKFYENLVKFM